MQKPIRSSKQEAENYFMSMTDMMIGVLFVFIIMLMAFALNLKTTESEATGNYETRKEILQQLKQFMAEEGVNVIIEVENGILRLPEEILFDSGRAEIKPRGLDALGKLHAAFLKILPCYTVAEAFSKESCKNERGNYIDTIFIEGHTDDIPINTARYPTNWELSTSRAISTFQALSSFQPLIDELKNQNKRRLFSVSGYADTREAETSTTDIRERRQKNRRIDIRFIMATPSVDQIRELEANVKEQY